MTEHILIKTYDGTLLTVLKSTSSNSIYEFIKRQVLGKYEFPIYIHIPTTVEHMDSTFSGWIVLNGGYMWDNTLYSQIRKSMFEDGILYVTPSDKGVPKCIEVLSEIVVRNYKRSEKLYDESLEKQTHEIENIREPEDNPMLDVINSFINDVVEV